MVPRKGAGYTLEATKSDAFHRYSFKAFIYNCQAVPVLNYEAQLLPLPDAALESEKHVLHSTTHKAINSFRIIYVFVFAYFGPP